MQANLGVCLGIGDSSSVPEFESYKSQREKLARMGSIITMSKSKATGIPGSEEGRETQPVVSESENLLESEEKKPNTQPSPTFREKKRGIWTLYYPLTYGPKTSLVIPGLWEIISPTATVLCVWWRFFSEVFSLGPCIVSVYIASLVISSTLPSIKLKNDSNLLGLVEVAMAGKTQHTIVIAKFRRVFIEYIATLTVVWMTNILREYSGSIVEQRVSFHFERQILAVQSRLELGVFQDPKIDAGLRSVKRYTSKASTTLSSLLKMLSAATELIALVSILKTEFVSHEGLNWLSLWPIAYPILLGLRGLVQMGDEVGYGKVTNQNWLRMQALYKIGTEDKYKQETLGSGLEDYIDTEYARAMSGLGDISTGGPWYPEQTWFSLDDLGLLFDSLPLVLYAWITVHAPSNFSLSAVLKIQQTNTAMQMAARTMIRRLKSVSNLSYNITTLYEVLSFQPGIVDGHVSYPDEAHTDQKGMAIEFKNVGFGYPMAANKVLKNVSFKVEPGQLCVIVGENGCGKSTTINLINRLYDCDSGEIWIDGCPIREYKVSTLRAAVNVMYQSYAYFPLTIKENLLMGNPSPINAEECLENATKLGGAYDFIQQLPLKFETNLEPIETGWTLPGCSVADCEQFKSLAATEKQVELSGGQWQRLALSRSFMKNSENTRLLCYDEPSASLDPKAEVAMFERLRSLRGEKTMIFVTHRFGQLTKHAGLIVYIGNGEVAELGTHKSLLAKGGEYAKMYNLQSEAFVDAGGL